jgi:hypothetical protein
MHCVHPDREDLREIAGRLFEATDLVKAIESGHLHTVEEVLAWAKASVSDLQAVLNRPQWIVNDSCCVDIQASIGLNPHVPHLSRHTYT